jgi:hypothetical protein
MSVPLLLGTFSQINFSMSNEVGRRIVDQFRDEISTQFEVQAVANETLRVWLEKRAQGFVILESPLNGARESSDSSRPASVAPFKGKDVAEALRKCTEGATSLIGALLPDYIVPSEGWPLTVLAEARFMGARPARLLLAAGFEFVERKLPVEPVYLAIEEKDCAFKAVRVSIKPLLAALETDSDLFDAAFEVSPDAISLLFPFVPGARELAESQSIKVATPTPVEASSQTVRLRL